MKNRLFIAASMAGLLAAAPAAAETYVSLSGGAAMLGDSANQGAFSTDFTTGEGVAVPAGTVLPAGTELGWNTGFDTGYALAGAIGRRYGMVRGEIEVAYQNNGVDTHTDVTVGGGALGGADAGVLITGSPALGATVADLVADGQGDVSTLFVLANVFVDIPTGGPLKPYIGGGAGIGFVNVDYSPSGVGVIDDNSAEFAWQLMAGLAYAVAPSTELFAGYRYRATSDAGVDVALFPAALEIQNKASVVEAGLRFSF